MTSRSARARTGSGALAAAGLLFLLYPATRPWEDEGTAEGAMQAMGSAAWVASHSFAMLGFVLVALGVLAVWGALPAGAAERLGGAAVVAVWVGAGLTLAYYGAETFGLHGIARVTDQGTDLLAAVEAVRFDPVAVTAFGIGLVVLAAGAVIVAVALRRSGLLPGAAGVVFALGFVLFLPQFFTPPAVRIGHGVLVAAGCWWVAWGLWASTVHARGEPAVPSGSSAASLRTRPE